MNQEYKFTTQISDEMLNICPEAKKHVMEECIVQLIKSIPPEKVDEMFDIDFVDEYTAYKRSHQLDLSLSEREYWYYIFCKLRDGNYSEITVKLK